METQAVIESVTHACTYAQMYFLFNNQECALLASILLCVCVFQRLVWKSEKHISKIYSQEILVYIPSVRAFMPQVLKAGRVVESLAPLEHWVWAVHIPDGCSSSPKPPRQYLLQDYRIWQYPCTFIQLLASPSSLHFFSLFLIFTIPSLRNIL